MRKIQMVVSVLVTAGLLAACGSSGSQNPSGSGSGSTSKKNASGGKSTTQALGARTIKGAGNVLTAPDGLTLYMRTTDRNGKITCTGKCKSNWPPLIASGSLPELPPGVSGKLATVMRPDDGDKQVTFAGHPLYTFVGDSAPGQANGQGLDGVWFGMKTSGSSGGGGGGGNGGGYGY